MGNLTLNGATSGQITLAPTAVAGTNTLTLPAATGTVLTTAGGQTISGTVTLSTLTSPAATALTIQSAGTTAMTIDTSQNVGIGTTSPSSYGNGLVVYNSATGVVRSYGGAVGAYMFASSGGGVAATGTETNHPFAFYTNNSERARIDTSGNVGIGTNSPITKLHIASPGSTNPSFIIPDATNNRYSVGIGSVNVGGVGQRMDFYAGDSGANGTNLGSGALRMSLDANGNLLVNTTTAWSRFAVQHTGASQFGITTVNPDTSGVGQTSVAFVRNGSYVGTINTTSSATSYNTSSDYRLKHSVAPMTTGLATVSALKPVTYKWNADDSNGEGFIAHELQAVIPLAVSGERDAVDADGNPIHQGVDYSKIVVHLVAAIQELKAELDALKGTK